MLSWVDTAGINRVKTIPAAPLDSAAAWGVGMSPVFDTFLANDSIVTTDVLGGPDGDLRLFPDLDRLVRWPGSPAGPGRRSTGSPRTAWSTRPAAAAGCGTWSPRPPADGLTVQAGVEIEFALGLAEEPRLRPGLLRPRVRR